MLLARFIHCLSRRCRWNKHCFFEKKNHASSLSGLLFYFWCKIMYKWNRSIKSTLTINLWSTEIFIALAISDICKQCSFISKHEFSNNFWCSGRLWAPTWVTVRKFCRSLVSSRKIFTSKELFQNLKWWKSTPPIFLRTNPYEQAISPWSAYYIINTHIGIPHSADLIKVRCLIKIKIKWLMKP